MPVLGSSPRQLLDPPAGERGEILLRAPERRKRRSTGLVRQRHCDLGAGREGLEQTPFRPGQIFESVGEHRAAVPRIELRSKPLDCTAAQQVPVPEPEPVELRAIRGVQQAEIPLHLRRLEQAGLELAEHREQRVGKACEPGGAPEAIERSALRDSPATSVR